MTTNGAYRFLQPKCGSRYRQLCVNGSIFAEVIQRRTVGKDPQTPEEVAVDYGIPLEAVLEAIHYCEHHPETLAADRAKEEASIKRHRLNEVPYVPNADS